jgi:hypothetical protein
MARKNADELRHALDAVLGAYQKHFCVAEWEQLPYSLDVDGPNVHLTVEVDTNTRRTVAGRFSAFAKAIAP